MAINLFVCIIYIYNCIYLYVCIRVATVPLYLLKGVKDTFIPLKKGILKGMKRYSKGV